MLLHRGAKPAHPSTAAAAGDIEYFEREVDADTINAVHLEENHSGATYLMYACRAGAAGMVDYLLDKYGDQIVADAQNRDNGETALITAARYGHIDIVRKLIRWAEKPHGTRYASRPTETGLERIERSGGMSDGERLAVEATSKAYGKSALSRKAGEGASTTVLMALSGMTNADPKAHSDALEMLEHLLSTHFAHQLERAFREKHGISRDATGKGGSNPIKVKQKIKDFANLSNADGETALGALMLTHRPASRHPFACRPPPSSPADARPASRHRGEARERQDGQHAQVQLGRQPLLPIRRRHRLHRRISRAPRRPE